MRGLELQDHACPVSGDSTVIRSNDPAAGVDSVPNLMTQIVKGAMLTSGIAVSNCVASLARAVVAPGAC